MKKIKTENYPELAVFLMDYYHGQWSFGYRLLSKLNPEGFNETICAELRKTECYKYLVRNYTYKV